MTKVLCDTVSGGIEQLKAETLSVIAAVSKLTAGKGQKVSFEATQALGSSTASLCVSSHPVLCSLVCCIVLFSSGDHRVPL